MVGEHRLKPTPLSCIMSGKVAVPFFCTKAKASGSKKLNVDRNQVEM